MRKRFDAVTETEKEREARWWRKANGGGGVNGGGSKIYVRIAADVQAKKKEMHQPQIRKLAVVGWKKLKLKSR